jgi:cell division protein FtsQ
VIRLIKFFLIFIIILFLLIFYFKKEYFFLKFKNIIVSYSNYTGMLLNEVYVNKKIGSNVNNDNIIEVLNIDIGDPINSFSINNIRKRVNVLPWVKDTKVFLRPFGKLDIVVLEYTPFGVLQYKGNNYLIDEDGFKFKVIKALDFPEIFRLSGDGATLSIKELPPLIQKLNQLNLKVEKIERVDLRRWNFHTKKGFLIKLPNINAINSIDYLYQLNNMDYNNLHSIDLRIENRISLKYNKD